MKEQVLGPMKRREERKKPSLSKIINEGSPVKELGQDTQRLLEAQDPWDVQHS